MSKLLWVIYFFTTLIVFCITIYITSNKFDFAMGTLASVIGSLFVGLIFPLVATKKEKKTTVLWIKDSIRKPLNNLHDWLSSCSTVLDGYPQNVSDAQQYKKANTKLKSSLRALGSLEQMSVEGEKRK